MATTEEKVVLMLRLPRAMTVRVEFELDGARADPQRAPPIARWEVDSDGLGQLWLTYPGWETDAFGWSLGSKIDINCHSDRTPDQRAFYTSDEGDVVDGTIDE